MAISEEFAPCIFIIFKMQCEMVAADFGFINIKMVLDFHLKIFEFLK